ncbi:MAG: trypsin-like peptidase domain-containing protein [Pseudomonadota bacterium]
MARSAGGMWNGAAGPVWCAVTLAVALLIVLPTSAFAQTSTRQTQQTRGPSLERALRSVVSLLPVWPRDGRRREEPEASGVVWRDGRHIVTAAHVVQGARAIFVRRHDGEIIAATMRGRDSATDLAVLKLAGDRRLPPMLIERATPVLGAPVCTIGNAFGLGLSVSCGVVSGVHRTGTGFNPIEDFVQTDAGANPGASGGALMLRGGPLVGLITGIFTKQGDANIGVNFAVSVALLERVVGDLIAHGAVRRVATGLRLRAAKRRLQVGPRTVRVAAVREGSPAALAGVRAGDIIVRANARAITRPADMARVAGLTPWGGSVRLDVRRQGTLKQLEMRLGGKGDAARRGG